MVSPVKVTREKPEQMGCSGVCVHSPIWLLCARDLSCNSPMQTSDSSPYVEGSRRTVCGNEYGHQHWPRSPMYSWPPWQTQPIQLQEIMHHSATRGSWWAPRQPGGHNVAHCGCRRAKGVPAPRGRGGQRPAGSAHDYRNHYYRNRPQTGTLVGVVRCR